MHAEIVGSIPTGINLIVHLYFIAQLLKFTPLMLSLASRNCVTKNRPLDLSLIMAYLLYACQHLMYVSVYNETVRYS